MRFITTGFNVPKPDLRCSGCTPGILTRDVTVRAKDGDVVLVRSGFHPVVAGPGYNVYYLNYLAGTSRVLAVTRDPNHVWLKSTWKNADPRLPMVR